MNLPEALAITAQTLYETDTDGRTDVPDFDQLLPQRQDYYRNVAIKILERIDYTPARTVTERPFVLSDGRGPWS